MEVLRQKGARYHGGKGGRAWREAGQCEGPGWPGEESLGASEVNRDGRHGPVGLEPVGAQEGVRGGRTWKDLVLDLMGQRREGRLVERLTYILLV